MKKLWSATSVLVLSAAMAVGQTDLGTISGTITDATGAIVPNAMVTLTNTATRATRTLPTNDRGEYNAAAVPLGPYTVTVSASGFSTLTQKFTVAVGSTNTINAKLTAGSNDVTIDVVSDNFSGVQLGNSEISQVIDQKQITELPTINRDPYALASLSGFASSDPSAASRGVGFNLSGARSSSVDILLDGAENTNLFGVGVGQTVPLDGVAEYRILTSNFGPEYGRASGGVVNVSTKAGTNQFHGTAYEFNRVSTFASNGYNNNALGLKKSRFVRNVFGYSLGGPVYRDKLFFFSTTEWTRIRSNATIIAEVPDAALLTGSAANTQAFFSQYGKLAQPTTGKTYTLSYLAATGPYKSDAAKLIAPGGKFAGQGALPAFDEIIYQNPGDSGAGTPQNTYNTTNRVDYTFSDRTTITGRYSLNNIINFPGTVNTSPYAGYNTGQTTENNNGFASLTHVFSPAITSSSKLLYTRYNNQQPLSTAPVGPTLYSNSASAQGLGNGTIYFPGYSATSPGNAIPFGGPQNEIQAIEDLTITKGKHTMAFGGDFLYLQDNRVFGAYENAVAALVQSGNTGALTNFVNGNLGYLNVAIDPQGHFPCARSATTNAVMQTPACTISLPISSPKFSRSNRYKDYAAYANDTFKASPRLTLNAGLRWEVYGPQHSNTPLQDSNFYFGAGSTIQQQIRNGQVLQRPNAPNGQLWKTNYKQFAPRVGFAYDVFGDGRTSFRAGYGISYERNFNNVTYNVIQNPPAYGVVAFTAADNAGVPIPISNNNFGNFGTGTGTKALPPVTLRAVDPNIKPSYNHFYSASLQHAVSNNTTVLVEYTGERGVHNYSIANINRSYFGSNYLGDPAGVATRLNLQYSNINFRGADGDSYYNGLNLGLRSANLGHQGITAIANYTYGHSTDNTSSTFTDGASNTVNSVAYLDPFNHGLDHGNSDFDIRHRITAALIWQIPYADHLTGVANRVLAGWTIAPNFTATTGTPFSLFDCSYAVTVCPRVMPNVALTRARTGDETDLSGTYGPNTFGYITEPVYNATNYTQYQNPNEHGGGDIPTCGSSGCLFPSNMTARNAFRGPGLWNLDTGVYKTVKFTEQTSLQLRFEGFNITNHANTHLNLSSASDVSTYNSVLAYKGGNGQLDRRQVQLAAKFIF